MENPAVDKKTWIEDQEEESEENVLDGLGSGYFPALTPYKVQLLLDNTRCLPTTSHFKRQKHQLWGIAMYMYIMAFN